MSYHKSASNVHYQPSLGYPAEGFADTPAQDYAKMPLVGTTTQARIRKTDNFAQAGALYRSMSEKDKQHLIGNLAADFSTIQNKQIVNTMVSYFYQADADYGQRLMKALKIEKHDVTSLIESTKTTASVQK